jgi:hypothetical protein
MLLSALLHHRFNPPLPPPPSPQTRGLMHSVAGVDPSQEPLTKALTHLLDGDLDTPGYKVIPSFVAIALNSRPQILHPKTLK